MLQQNHSVIPTEEQPAIKSSESFDSCSEDSLPSCEFDKLEVEGQQETESQNILQKEVDFSEFYGSLCLTGEEYRNIIKGLARWLKKYLSSASCEESVRKSFDEITEKLVEFSGYPTNALCSISEGMKKIVEDIYVVANRIFKHYENKKCNEQIKSKHRETIKAVRIVDYVLRSLGLYRVYGNGEFLYAALISTREYRALLLSKLKKLNSENFISMIKEAGKREESELTDDKFGNEELKNFYKKVKLMENDISNAITDLENQKGIIKEKLRAAKHYGNLCTLVYTCTAR